MFMQFTQFVLLSKRGSSMERGLYYMSKYVREGLTDEMCYLNWNLKTVFGILLTSVLIDI